LNSERIRALQAFVAWTSLKVIAGLLVIFVIVRIAIPYLVNAHSDAMALAALALGVATLVGAGWFGFSLWLSVTRFRQSRSDAPLLANPTGPKR
jgi:hypothetical protein